MKKIEVFAAHRCNGRLFVGKVADIIYIGEISPERVWHLANHFYWSDSEIPYYDRALYFPLKNDIGIANTNIWFNIGAKWFAAKEIGFESFRTQEAAKQFVLRNCRWIK